MDMGKTLSEMVESRSKYQCRRVRVRAVPYTAACWKKDGGVRMSEIDDIYRAMFSFMMFTVDYRGYTDTSAVSAHCRGIVGDDYKIIAEIYVDKPTNLFECHSDMMNACHALAKSHGVSAYVCEPGENADIYKINEEFEPETKDTWLAFEKIEKRQED